MNAEGKGAERKQWENIGQNGKWNFWYFNNLIIVEILTGFTTDRNFSVEYEERETLMDVLWRSPTDEVRKAGKRCKYEWIGHSTTWC